MERSSSFVVSRKTWFRGQGSVDSRLLTENGKKCCVGFYATSCGAKPEQILDLGRLDSVEGLPSNLVRMANTETIRKIYGVNDSQNMDDEEREDQLTRLFKQLKIKIVFKG